MVDTSHLDWDNFKVTFLDIFFLLKMRAEKVLEFIKILLQKYECERVCLEVHTIVKTSFSYGFQS